MGRHPFKGVEAQTLIWRISRGHVSRVDVTDFPLVFKVSLFFNQKNIYKIQKVCDNILQNLQIIYIIK